MDLDLDPLLADFPYRDGELSARKLVGRDGREKIQIRIQCGIVQFEADGHPAGERPFGHDSLLLYQRSRLASQEALSGSDSGFSLSPADCAALREEAVLYYARYVAASELRDHARALRDTERNLEVMDLCRRYAEESDDREALEGYRPFVLLMQARARAGQMIELGEIAEATQVVADAARLARERTDPDPPAEPGEEAAVQRSVASFLEEALSSVVPESVSEALSQLRRELADAVEREDYRRAAELRDEIRRREDEV